MKKSSILVIAIILFAVLAAGYFAVQRVPPAPQPETAPTEQRPTAVPAPVAAPQAPSVTEVTVTMNSQNNSGESGLATLTAQDGRTKVVLNLVGAPEDVIQPAHIHIGSCADIGAVKYPLTFPVNGKSLTVLDMPLENILSELPLAVNVHKSREEANVYVSCGDIVK